MSAPLRIDGRLSEAVEAARRAIALDPLNRAAWSHLGQFLIEQGDLKGARRVLGRALEISPESAGTLYDMGILELLDSHPEAARTAFAKLPDPLQRNLGIALTQHSLGHRAESQRALEEIIAGHSQDNAYQIGEVYAWRGENDKAIEWLDRAYRQRDSGLTDLKTDRVLASVRGDSRYKALLKKLKLPE